MLRLIEIYRDASQVTIAGRSYPGTCLVEDDDALRYLVIDTDAILPGDFLRAQAAGAVALVQPQGDRWRFMLVEAFVEGYEEARGTLVVPDFAWSRSRESWPSYPQLVLSEESVTLPDPSELASGSGFVHLHAHSEYSALDGLATIQEMVDTAAAHGDSALAVTDHGVCSAHPELQAVATKVGIKPIFGMEANFTDDRLVRGVPGAPETDPLFPRRVLNDYRHLILWAMSERGLRNLWAMASHANVDGFYGRPRLDWDVLGRYSEDVACSTACLRGPLSTALVAGDDDLVLKRLAMLQNIFPDRLYIELHTNRLEAQQLVNQALVQIASEHSLPMIAVSDAHYACPEDKRLHQIWIAAQTQKDLVADDKDLFGSDENYHLHDANEVVRSLDYLASNVVAEAMANTVEVARRCDATIRSRTEPPVYSKKGGPAADVDRVLDLALDGPNWALKCRGKRLPESDYVARFEREMALLVSKGLCGQYLIVWDYVQHAKDNRVLVGPGRGSGAGSIVAYLLGLTAPDPVDVGLLFERFLTPGRMALPDFDEDFPSSKHRYMEDYCRRRWGEEHVARVGSVMRLKSKGVIRKVAQVMRTEMADLDWRDIDVVCDLIEKAERSSAGLGIPWEDLWVEHEDVLGPYRQKYPEFFAICDRLVGRVSTYGKHAAGIVINPDANLYETAPLRRADEDDDVVLAFDMEAAELLNLIKFDLLVLRNLDTLQLAIDLVRADHDIDTDPWHWRDEYNDAGVWDMLCHGDTLGIFQIETRDGTALTKRFGPRSLSELAAVLTLVRPGPSRSGLTESYLRRRAGLEAVTYVDPRLADVLAHTEGTIIYQEQVMQACQHLGGYTLEEADEVRRILGKKKVDKVVAEGARFVPACVARGMTEPAATALWDQLGEFAKYSFGLSHAYGYAMLAYWTAWFKHHYPLQFLTAVLSTVKKDRIPEFVNEARRLGYKVLPPHINESRSGFRVVGDVVRYGLDSVKTIGTAVVEAIVPGQPYADWADFLERKGSACNAGHLRTLASIGAFDCWFSNRRALEKMLDDEANGVHERCGYKNDDIVNSWGLPCTFDWAAEPVEIGKSGRPLKRKAPPKRCTKACRHYTPPLGVGIDWGIEPYTEVEVRERERDVLGVYLSSTPFDEVPPDVLDRFYSGYEIEHCGSEIIPLIGIVTRLRRNVDKNGRDYAFVSVQAKDGETIDAVCFSSVWEQARSQLVPDALVMFNVSKANNRYQIREALLW